MIPGVVAHILVLRDDVMYLQQTQRLGRRKIRFAYKTPSAVEHDGHRFLRERLARKPRRMRPDLWLFR